MKFKFKIKMSSFHIELIQLAFSRCHGLKDSLISAIKNDDSLLKSASIDSLANQTGFRKTFLEENLHEIILL